MTVHDFFLHILNICKLSLNLFGTIDNVKRDLMSYRQVFYHLKLIVLINTF